MQDREAFCERLDALTEIRGKSVVEAWKASVHSGQIEPVVRELLTLHYDPVYLQSMQRNFSQFADAKTIAPANRSAGAMAELVKILLAK